MKLCINCKHHVQHEIPYYPLQQHKSTIAFNSIKHLCKKAEGTEYSPITGALLSATESSLCTAQRDKEPSTLYPRCGYDGKWFEVKDADSV